MRLFPLQLPWQNQHDPHRPLLARAQSGDRVAFRALYEALYEPVTRFIFRRIKSRQDAEDLTSRVFHVFVERLADIDPEKGNARMFVLTIARNAIIDFSRTRRLHAPLEEAVFAVADERGTPLDSMLEEEKLRVVRAAITKLPRDTQELLLLKYGDGLKHAEIAELLGETTANIKQKLSRAQRVLRELLLEEQSNPSGNPEAEARKGAAVNV